MRFQEHLNGTYRNAYTKKTADWEVYLEIENLEYRQARAIEKHVKSMKSKKYIQNLRKYPEMIEKLVSRYA